MSLWLDITFLKRVSYRLDLFKIKKDGDNFVSICRCPLCGDSKKNPHKCRGYFYVDDGYLKYKCHNCGALHTFYEFLSIFDPPLFSEYRLERYREKVGNTPERRELSANDAIVKTSHIAARVTANSLLDPLPTIASLDATHPATKYIRKRKLPVVYDSRFFYAEKFIAWAKTTTDRFDAEHFSEVHDHPRIVIPWYDKNGVMFAYQARSLGKEEPKYYTIILDESVPKIFGLDTVNESRPVYIFEGPLDSLFIPNAIAVGSSALSTYHGKEADVYCFDNERRNPDIVKLMSGVVKRGRQIFIPPDNYHWKDINDAVEKGGMEPSAVFKMIRDNTYSGLSAQMKFNKWKRS